MYIIQIKTILGKLSIASTSGGVSRVIIGKFPGPCESGDPFGAAAQIEEFLAGKRQQFDLPIDIEGTEFQNTVWNAASGIPYGCTLTYGQLAQKITRPKAVRAVGGALSKNPVPILIPCHRIVGSAGLTGYALGLDIKKKLLALEQANQRSL